MISDDAKNAPKNEVDKHHLKFDRPQIYKCNCGVVAYMSTTDFVITDMPSKEITYLACGHASCSKTPNFSCIICAMKGLT